jgi:hypothetical protein
MKFPSINKAVNEKEITITLAPFFILKMRCNIKKATVNNNGIKAGNKVKLSIKFPLVNSTKDLCAPQPGHSIPNVDLK